MVFLQFQNPDIFQKTFVSYCSFKYFAFFPNMFCPHSGVNCFERGYLRNSSCILSVFLTIFDNDTCGISVRRSMICSYKDIVLSGRLPLSVFEKTNNLKLHLLRCNIDAKHHVCDDNNNGNDMYCYNTMLRCHDETSVLRLYNDSDGNRLNLFDNKTFSIQ
jgi:hypothetical protein